SPKIAAMPTGDNGLRTRTHQHGRPATAEERRVLNPTSATPINPPLGQEPKRDPIPSQRTDNKIPATVNASELSDEALDLIDPDAIVHDEPAPPAENQLTDFQQPLWDHLIEEEQKKQKAQNEVDELWDEAVSFVRKSGKASTSMLQRRFRIGYTRSARIIDAMEDAGIIGPPTGTSKAREVIVSG
ncbi:MAG TPA: hypothetical protein ENJ56_00040, partial [Anaerolineae bacterium]|nr:hypothetical protein [Anaerolineae bacterium]